MKWPVVFLPVVAMGGALGLWVVQTSTRQEPMQAPAARLHPDNPRNESGSLPKATVPELAAGRSPIAAVRSDPDPRVAGAPDVDRAPATRGDPLAEAIAEIERLRRALDECEHPESTPFGAFVRSSEGRRFTTEEDRRTIQKWLARFPVELAPGEATWLIERARANDWKAYALTADRAVIQFLRPARLMRDLSPDVGAALRKEYESEVLFP